MKLKANYKKLTLRIDGFTPYTLPMGRLAEYLKDLAAIFGTQTDAHFIEVGDGSAELRHAVPEREYPIVHGRIVGAQRGDGPEEAVRSYRDLRAKLRQDQAPDKKPAVFADYSGKKIIVFPKQEAEPVGFGTISQPGALDGTLIKLGGRDETVPVHLQEGERFYKCTATRQMARQLAPFLFAGSIRLHGVGKWCRTEDGDWNLENFRIQSFEALSDDELPVVLSRMRVPESEWDKMEDPLGELKRIRKGSSKVQ